MSFKLSLTVPIFIISLFRLFDVFSLCLSLSVATFCLHIFVIFYLPRYNFSSIIQFQFLGIIYFLSFPYFPCILSPGKFWSLELKGLCFFSFLMVWGDGYCHWSITRLKFYWIWCWWHNKMKDFAGTPGTLTGLALRLSQCIFAAGSITAMATTSSFFSFTAFWYYLLLPVSVCVCVRTCFYVFMVSLISNFELLFEFCYTDPIYYKWA